VGVLAFERGEDLQNWEGLDQEVLGLVAGSYQGKEGGCHLGDQHLEQMEVDLW